MHMLNPYIVSILICSTSIGRCWDKGVLCFARSDDGQASKQACHHGGWSSEVQLADGHCFRATFPTGIDAIRFGKGTSTFGGWGQCTHREFVRADAHGKIWKFAHTSSATPWQRYLRWQPKPRQDSCFCRTCFCSLLYGTTVVLSFRSVSFACSWSSRNGRANSAIESCVFQRERHRQSALGGNIIFGGRPRRTFLPLCHPLWFLQ